MDDLKAEWIAPEGKIWSCRACGKRAKYLAGPAEGLPASHGWDESCALNCDLVDEETK